MKGREGYGQISKKFMMFDIDHSQSRYDGGNHHCISQYPQRDYQNIQVHGMIIKKRIWIVKYFGGIIAGMFFPCLKLRTKNEDPGTKMRRPGFEPGTTCLKGRCSTK